MSMERVVQFIACLFVGFVAAAAVAFQGGPDWACTATMLIVFNIYWSKEVE